MSLYSEEGRVDFDTVEGGRPWRDETTKEYTIAHRQKVANPEAILAGCGVEAFQKYKDPDVSRSCTEKKPGDSLLVLCESRLQPPPSSRLADVHSLGSGLRTGQMARPGPAMSARKCASAAFAVLIYGESRQNGQVSRSWTG